MAGTKLYCLVNNLPKVVTQHHLEQDLNLQPVARKPKCLTCCTTAPPHHHYTVPRTLALYRSAATLSMVRKGLGRYQPQVDRYQPYPVSSLHSTQCTSQPAICNDFFQFTPEMHKTTATFLCLSNKFILLCIPNTVHNNLHLSEVFLLKHSGNTRAEVFLVINSGVKPR